jgi:hypothetical protein
MRPGNDVTESLKQPLVSPPEWLQGLTRTARLSCPTWISLTCSV